jgi:hypothetical protein
MSMATMLGMRGFLVGAYVEAEMMGEIGEIVQRGKLAH